MDLLKLSYEDINTNFSLCIYHMFNIIVNKRTGFFNASKLVIEFGKDINDWFKLYNKIPLEDKVFEDLESVRGLYLSQEYILPLCMWISKDFQQKCFKITKDYFVNDFNVLNKDEDLLKIKLIKMKKLKTLVLNKNVE